MRGTLTAFLFPSRFLTSPQPLARALHTREETVVGSAAAIGGLLDPQLAPGVALVLVRALLAPARPLPGVVTKDSLLHAMAHLVEDTEAPAAALPVETNETDIALGHIPVLPLPRLLRDEATGEGLLATKEVVLDTRAEIAAGVRQASGTAVHPAGDVSHYGQVDPALGPHVQEVLRTDLIPHGADPVL